MTPPADAEAGGEWLRWPVYGRRAEPWPPLTMDTETGPTAGDEAGREAAPPVPGRRRVRWDEAE